MSQVGTLGCAQRYDAAVHWQGGRNVFCLLDSVTEITWRRKLGDYSEASVTLAKPALSPQCWSKLAPEFDQHGAVIKPGLSPWAHELSIYRDHRLVWQGPIVEWVESRDSIEISARDVLAWMDRRVVDLNLAGGTPDGDRFRGETGLVLRNIFERTWPGTHETNPFDNPGITEHARIDDTPGKWTETERIWKGSRTVGDLVRDIVKNGVDMFTLGRKVYLVPDFYRIEHDPHRLSDQHIFGDFEIRCLGLDMATEGFVTGQGEATGANAAPLFGKHPPEEGPGGPGNPSTPAYYGRITRFHQANSLSGPPPPPPGAPAPPPAQNPSPALQQVAQTIRDYGWRPGAPLALVLPDQASLAPHAPITIGQLVPGRVVEVGVTNYVHQLRELTRINEIEVTWTAGSSGQQSSSRSSTTTSSSQGGSSSSTTSSSGSTTSGQGGQASGPEQVKISLVTLRQPPIPQDSGSSSTASSSASGAT